MKKRIITTILLLIMSALFITPTFAIVKPSKAFYVADYANVIDSSTEQYIIDANATLEYEYFDAQIVVVSVEYLDGLYADEYALQILNDWGVGSEYYNNGMVLLFSTKENKAWLATGDGIDRGFTDEVANEYMDKYFFKQFDKGNYDKAVKKLFVQLEKWYEKNHNHLLHLYNPFSNNQSDDEQIISIGIIIGLVMIFMIHIIMSNDSDSDNSDDTSDSHHSHHHRSHRSSSSRSYSSSSNRSSSSRSRSSSGRGRGGGGRSGGGGGGRR